MPLELESARTVLLVSRSMVPGRLHALRSHTLGTFQDEADDKL